MPKTLQALFWLTLIYIQIVGLNYIDAKEHSINETKKKSTYQDCIFCHENEYKHWQQSDHAKSMAIADESSVLADFDDVEISNLNGQYFFQSDVGKPKTEALAGHLIAINPDVAEKINVSQSIPAIGVLSIFFQSISAEIL